MTQPDVGDLDGRRHPTEHHNLAGEAASAPVLAEMRGRLEAWMKRTDDPLLREAEPWCDQATMRFYPQFLPLEGYRTLKKLASSRQHIVPGHDPQVFQRFPRVAPGVVRIE